MSKLRKGNKDYSTPGSLDCEIGILPLSYRALCKLYSEFQIVHVEWILFYLIFKIYNFKVDFYRT